MIDLDLTSVYLGTWYNLIPITLFKSNQNGSQLLQSSCTKTSTTSNGWTLLLNSSIDFAVSLNLQGNGSTTIKTSSRPTASGMRIIKKHLRTVYYTRTEIRINKLCLLKKANLTPLPQPLIT